MKGKFIGSEYFVGFNDGNFVVETVCRLFGPFCIATIEKKKIYIYIYISFHWNSIVDLISGLPVGSDSMMNKLNKLKQLRGRWVGIFYLPFIIIAVLQQENLSIIHRGEKRERKRERDREREKPIFPAWRNTWTEFRSIRSQFWIYDDNFNDNHATDSSHFANSNWFQVIN